MEKKSVVLHFNNYIQIKSPASVVEEGCGAVREEKTLSVSKLHFCLKSSLEIHEA